MRLAAAVPRFLGLCAATVVVAIGSVAGVEVDRPDAGDFSVPRQMAGYSYVTGSV